MIFINLTDKKLNITDVYTQLNDKTCGGCVVFQGSVRNIYANDTNPNPSKSVKNLDFQAYQSMAEKQLNYLAQEIKQKFKTVKRVALHHKVGLCDEGEACVFVGVVSEHREELFAACDFGIFELKKRVPIWKKEIYYDGSESKWLENCECMKKAKN